MIEKMNTAALEATLDDESIDGQTCFRIERELNRRNYDSSDPWSPENHHD